MKIKNFKKKILCLSILLIAIGVILAFVGLYQNNFSKALYEEANGHRWYQTLYLEEGNWTFGVTIGPNLSITKIGGRNHSFVMFHVSNSALPEPPEPPAPPTMPTPPTAVTVTDRSE